MVGENFAFEATHPFPLSRYLLGHEEFTWGLYISFFASLESWLTYGSIFWVLGGFLCFQWWNTVYCWVPTVDIIWNVHNFQWIWQYWPWVVNKWRICADALLRLHIWWNSWWQGGQFCRFHSTANCWKYVIFGSLDLNWKINLLNRNWKPKNTDMDSLTTSFPCSIVKDVNFWICFTN